jgi:uncharacterized protein (DUF1697 family)
MNYVALLRGVNVGGKGIVSMKQLKSLFETLGYANVSTYINSGNIFFSSSKNAKTIHRELEREMKREFGFEIPTLVKTANEIKKIANAIPPHWKNDDKHKSDVTYLFQEIDSKKVLGELPFKPDLMEIKYVKGAILTRVPRENMGRSGLTKIVGGKLYRYLTIRNVNTARILADKS